MFIEIDKDNKINSDHIVQINQSDNSVLIVLSSGKVIEITDEQYIKNFTNL